MRKKGLVYRMTMILGISVIALQCCGELVYAKYFRSDRDLELEDVSHNLNKSLLKPSCFIGVKRSRKAEKIRARRLNIRRRHQIVEKGFHSQLERSKKGET